MPIPGVIPQGPVTAKDLRSPGLGRYLGLLICLLPEPGYLASPSNRLALGAGGVQPSSYISQPSCPVNNHGLHPCCWNKSQWSPGLMSIKWRETHDAHKIITCSSRGWEKGKELLLLAKKVSLISGCMSPAAAANKKCLFAGKESLSRSMLKLISAGLSSPVLN